MLGRRPFPHVVAALGDEPQHGVRAEAMDLGQIRAEQACRARAAHRSSARSVPLACRTDGSGLLRRRPLFVQRAQDRLDLRVALGDLGLVEIVELQRLAEGEDVFGAVVPRERLADGLLRGGAPDIAKLGECVGCLGPSDDGPDDPHPGDPGDVGRRRGAAARSSA